MYTFCTCYGSILKEIWVHNHIEVNRDNKNVCVQTNCHSKDKALLNKEIKKNNRKQQKYFVGTALFMS